MAQGKDPPCPAVGAHVSPPPPRAAPLPCCGGAVWWGAMEPSLSPGGLRQCWGGRGAEGIPQTPAHPTGSPGWALSRLRRATHMWGEPKSQSGWSPHVPAPAAPRGDAGGSGGKLGTGKMMCQRSIPGEGDGAAIVARGSAPQPRSERSAQIYSPMEESLLSQRFG